MKDALNKSETHSKRGRSTADACKTRATLGNVRFHLPSWTSYQAFRSS